MHTRTIEKKKIYRGMAEIKGYELDRAIKNNESVKFVYNGQYMILTPSQLKREKVFINIQKSIINEGQTYSVYGYRWKPTGMNDEQLSIDNTVMQRLGEEFRRKYGQT